MRTIVCDRLRATDSSNARGFTTSLGATYYTQYKIQVACSNPSVPYLNNYNWSNAVTGLYDAEVKASIQITGGSPQRITFSGSETGSLPVRPIFCIGDSIVAGQGVGIGFGGFVEQAARANNLPVVNCGIPGRRASDLATQSHKISNRSNITVTKRFRRIR